MNFWYSSCNAGQWEYKPNSSKNAKGMAVATWMTREFGSKFPDDIVFWQCDGSILEVLVRQRNEERKRYFGKAAEPLATLIERAKPAFAAQFEFDTGRLYQDLIAARGIAEGLGTSWEQIAEKTKKGAHYLHQETPTMPAVDAEAWGNTALWPLWRFFKAYRRIRAKVSGNLVVPEDAHDGFKPPVLAVHDVVSRYLKQQPMVQFYFKGADAGV